MPLKPSKTKGKTNGVKTKAMAKQMMPKSRAISQTVKQAVPESKQQPAIPQIQEPKHSAEDMIVELLKSDTKYTRKLLQLKMMGSGVGPKTFGRAIDLLELTMKIVYIPPEVISIQEKDNAVVRLKQRVVATRRTPI
jgi:hypothetical protein